MCRGRDLEVVAAREGQPTVAFGRLDGFLGGPDRRVGRTQVRVEVLEAQDVGIVAGGGRHAIDVEAGIPTPM